MAPELIKIFVSKQLIRYFFTEKSDVFSLGLTFFRLVFTMYEN